MSVFVLMLQVVSTVLVVESLARALTHRNK